MCSAANGTMIRNHEENEFIAVRVQDPRVQNEGSWNSYVDFKIFLHTNSKAFTAKTSCVRRRYSEFVWLKKKLQKNAGLVPVPDLPSKSFFSFSKEDFLEKRRKGLQCFLDKVLHMTVCLSDSQLHLFLQSQLTLVHIQDCVQGHTPYTVTEAILSYASSNQGWAQEEGVAQEHTLIPVPYESMESPVPHVPTMPSAESLTALHTLESIAIIHDVDTVELHFHQTESPLLVAPYEDDHAEAVLEIGSPVGATSLGDSQVESASQKLSSEHATHQQDCRQQAVEVPTTEAVEAESLFEAERALEANPVETVFTEIQPTQPNNYEEKCRGGTIENKVPDPVSHLESTQEDDSHTETRLRKDCYGGSLPDDDTQGHVIKTESHSEIIQKEEQNTDASPEMGSGDTATREEPKTTLIGEIEAASVGGEEVAGGDEDGEMLSEEISYRDEDLDEAPLSLDGSSLERVTENSSPDEVSRVTNGYLERTPLELNQNSDYKGVPNTDALEPRTGEATLLDDSSSEKNQAQEMNCVEVGDDEEIVYLTNICPAKTLLQMSSGLPEMDVEQTNDQEVVDKNNHLKSSGEHCPVDDDASVLAVEPDTKAPVKCRERERQFKDANLPVSSQEIEP